MHRSLIIDLIAIILLCFGSFLFAQKFVDFSGQPYEDAAILMRYAKNLGDGSGMVWNVGEKPVDGGTDFLLLLVMAGLYKTGVSLEHAIRTIGLVSHFITLLLVYFAARKIMYEPPLAAFISAAFFALGPGLFYIAVYFGTPFFALFACLTWIAALKIMQGNTSHVYSAAFAFLGLITGLIRPEGVILAGLMLLSIIFYLGLKKSVVPISWFASVFLLLGGAYFLWRWNLFGFPLPNPYYKKGGGHLYFSGLKNAIKNVFLMGMMFWLLYIPGLRSKPLRKMVAAYLLPVIGFTASFILISNEMNYAARFQYPLFSILLISWYPFIKELRQDLRIALLDSWPIITKILASIFFAGGLILFASLQVQVIKQKAMNPKDGRYAMALYLNQFKSKGYWMATSEAGLLPFYSEWNAIDTWGLNDQWIAHNGLITSEYLDRYKPQVIMFHAYFSPGKQNCIDPDPKWSPMVLVLEDYAENNPYTLAAVFGNNPCSTHYYYVRKDFRDSTRITAAIRDFNYPMGEIQSHNYAP